MAARPDHLDAPDPDALSGLRDLVRLLARQAARKAFASADRPAPGIPIEQTTQEWETMTANAQLNRAERLLTIQEVAERLQVNPRTIRRRIGAGELRALRIGRSLRIDPQDLRAFLARHSNWQ